MTTAISSAMAACIFFRVCVNVCSSFSFLSAPKMSSVNDVVRAVRAEPAAEKAAENNPTIKRIPTTTGR